MATVYGAVQGTQASGKVYQRGYMTYTITTTETQVIVSVQSGIQQGNKNWNTKIKSYCTIAATDYTDGTSILTTGGSYSAAWHSYQHFNRTYTYDRGTADATKYVTATSCLRSADNPTSVISSSYGRSAVINKTSSCSISVSVPRRTSYTVSYNANGGTGAPGNQTKWYNTDLTLYTVEPTRVNYRFVSWNTAADGSGTSYAPGATYSANAGVTLYAQWVRNALVAFAKVIDAIKRCTVYGKVNGTIVIPVSGYVKVNGVWKQIRDDV